MDESIESPPPVGDDADGDTSWVPKVDMEFGSDEEAYFFYNNYAREVGFSVRKSWVNRRASGVIISRTYVCYKEGFQGNKRDETEVAKPRASERTGCLAHMSIKINANGRYRVSEFHPMHNHELVPPTKANLLRSHRVMRKMRAASVKFVPPKATIEYLVRRAGGYRQVAFVSVEDAADKSWAPKVHMEFENDERAYEFYSNYANKIGFGVRKAWVNRKPSGVIISRTYVCYKEGYYGNKKNRSQVQDHRLLPSERTGCHARMTIKLARNGRYRVTVFHPIHNHELVTARTAHTLKSYRVCSKAVKDESRNGCNKLDEVVGELEGTPSPLSDLSIKNRHSISAKGKNSVNLGDVGAILQYMQQKQAEDPSFYYAIQLDETDQITNIFWADGRSMVDYMYFGDVICFDMTHKVNGYGRPFSPFLGINHHKHIIFIGAAFLYDETEASFNWLLEAFRSAMHGNSPKVILTDQNAALSNAIPSIWPGTKHRYCVWHIYQNAVKYLSQVFQGSRTFASDFYKCVYDCEEEEEFISAWAEMLEKYDLKGNDWLNKLFQTREKWSSAYGRDTFCADMKSALRRDTMSSMLKEYLAPDKDLLEFLKYFETAVNERRYAEIQADYQASQNIAKAQPSRMLRQAANVYTPSMFDMFQREFEMAMDCMVYCNSQCETVSEYQVRTEENLKEYLVRFDKLNGTFVCSCKMFEFSGIQCRHVLKALDIANIKELPARYILKRWTKDAKSGSIRDDVGRCASDRDGSFKLKRYTSLCRILCRLAARASEDVEAYIFTEDLSNQLMDTIHQMLRTRNPTEPQIS